MPVLKKNAPKKAKAARMKEEMREFKGGKLHSGSKTGPKVKDRKQAIAIALHESGQSKAISGDTKKDKAASPKKPSGNPSNRRKRNKGRS